MGRVSFRHPPFYFLFFREDPCSPFTIGDFLVELPVPPSEIKYPGLPPRTLFFIAPARLCPPLCIIWPFIRPVLAALRFPGWIDCHFFARFLRGTALGA